MRFKVAESDEKEAVVSLQQNENDVDILINGIPVAYFRGDGYNSLRTHSLIPSHVEELQKLGIKMDVGCVRVND